MKRYWLEGLVRATLGVLLALTILSGPVFANHEWFDPPRNWTGRDFFGDLGTFFADVTRDGKADAIAVNDDGVVVRRSDGCRFGPNERWTDNEYFGDVGTFFADVTGDGAADAIVVNIDGITVRQARVGSAGCRAGLRGCFGPNERWTDDAYFGDLGTFFADVTGASDGPGPRRAADAIAVNLDGITVRRAQSGCFGPCFGPSEPWTNNEYYGDLGRTFFADVDADGRDDAIVVNSFPFPPVGITVRRSQCCGIFHDFGRPEQWTTDPFFGTHRTFFADVTGRRSGGHAQFYTPFAADAIAVPIEGPIVVRGSNNTAPIARPPFNPPQNWTERNFFGLLGTFFADVTGDGTAEPIAVNANGVFVRRNRFIDYDDPCPNGG